MNLFGYTTEELEASGITFLDVASTLLYTVVGIIIMILALLVINKLFDLDMHKELVKDNNVAFGVMIGGIAIAIAIIVAGTITS
ncbi:MAG: DUF350 domain-containing protein [Candidatus Saccharimonadales bacterium]|nr:DUF350 domain-containing protein [Candidatus Saccharimonadales bacterium]